MPVCGPKLSLCCTIISIWGIFQLVLMGIFFYFNCVTLVDDAMPKGYIYTSDAQFQKDVVKNYTQNAHNCWIAACLYLATLAVSAHQLYMNNKGSTRP